MRAIIVFSYSIRYLKEHLLEKLLTSNLGDKVTVDDIDFVLTVPAIWDDTAKMFMREAAIQVRVGDKKKNYNNIIFLIFSFLAQLT